MKVWNPTDAGVFVKGYGVLQPGQDANVQQEVGEPLTKDGPLKAGSVPRQVAAENNNDEEGAA
jgi:hypothetical protein